MLNARQQRFVEEYIINPNAAEAARRAGYTQDKAARQGYKLLNNPEVRAAINDRLDELKTDKTLDQQALLEFLSAVVKGDVRDVQLMTRLTGKGFSVIEPHEYRAAVKDRIRAAELLLKIHGAFREAEEKADASKMFVDTLEKIWEEHGESYSEAQ